MMRIISVFLLVICSISRLQAQNTSSITPFKLRLDPQTAVPVPASEIYERVEYIPLELTTESTIGMISKMEIVGENIVVFDRDTYSVLFFNMDGGFLRKITSRQVAKHAGLSSAVPEGNVFNYFTAIHENNQSYLIIYSNKQFLYFTAEGDFLKLTKTVEHLPFLIFQNGTQMFTNYKFGDSTYNYTLKKGDDVKTFGAWKGNMLNFEELFRQGNGFYTARDKQSVLFVDYYSYDVHEINEKGPKLKYQFIFPSSHTLPADFLNNEKYNGKRWDYFVENRQAVIGMQNIVEVGDFLYFSLFSYVPGNTEKKNFALHMPSRKLISLQDVMPEEFTFFLPTNDAADGTNFLKKGFMNYDSNHFYTLISASSLQKYASENVDFKGKYPENLAKSIALGAKANPILVKITPKLK